MKDSILSTVLALFGILTSLAVPPSAGAATLNQGDVVITGFNAGNNTFSFMPLVNLPAGTTLSFTDRGWTTTSNAFNPVLGSGADGTMSWTCPSAVAAGTHFRVTINPTFGAGVPATSLTITNLNTSTSVTGGTIDNGWFNTTLLNAIDPFLATGDSLFIYQDAPTNPFFIFGFNNSSATVGADGWNTVETPTGTTTKLPNGTGSQNSLTAGVDAVGMTGGGSQLDNAEYTGVITLAPRAAWLNRLVTRANWTESNSTPTNTIGGLALIGSPTTTVTSLNRASADPTNAAFVNWTLTFATQVTGLSASNFSLSGAAATGSGVTSPGTSNGGLTWTIPVATGSTDGTLTLNLANSTGLTPGISTTLPFAGDSYTMDKTAPTIGIGSPSVSTIAAGAGSVTYTVTYADTNFSSSTLANGNITLNSTGSASGTVGVSGSGTTRTITLSSITGVGTLGISIAAGTASDTAGNTAPAAGPSTTFTVSNVPGAPTVGTATAGTNANATVTFTAPASDGGSPITSYSVTSAPGGVVNVGATSPITISGLTPGIVYTFRVQAFNANGPSALSAASNSITAVTVPGAPTIGTATAGNATASVAFTAPGSTGGSAILDYTVTSSPGGITATSATSPISVTGLTNGTPYTFTVTARNAAGSGTASAASNSVTPVAPAEIPISLASGALNVDASSSPGAANVVLRFVTGPGGPFLEIFDSTRTLGVPVGGTQLNPNTVRIPIASLTSITLTGSPQADLFTLNFTDGDICPPGGITVHGGDPTISPGDTLVLDGDFTSGGSYGTGSLGSGTVGLDSGNTVTFTGLEPVDMSAASFVDFTITVDPTAVFSGNVITTVAAVDAGVNTEVTFGSSGLESAKLGVVTGTLTIQGDNVEQDYFILQGLGSAMTGNFVVDGRGGDSDVIEINNTAITVAGVDKAVTLRADFVGVGRANQDVNTGVLNFKGPLTIEANGDFTVVTPLWGAGGVWGASVPAYFPSSAIMSARGNAIIKGELNKTGGADATVLIKATAGITTAGAVTMPVTTGGKIISTSNKAHITLNADSDANSVGHVTVGLFSTLTSNGGNITIGGGANPATTPAFGFNAGTTLTPGVVLQSCAITSGGGAISVRGSGFAAAGGHGIFCVSGNSANVAISSGSGNITMNGTSGAVTGLHGITQQNSATTDTVISSTTGQISLTGTASLANGDGIRLVGRTSITGTGAAPISLTGTGAGTGMGIMMTPATGQTTTVSSSSSVTLIADKMNLSGGVGTESINAVNSSVRLMPRTGGVVVNLGSSVDTTASTLEISATELDNINAGSIEVADGGLFPITVSAVIAPLNFKTLFLLSSTTFSATGGFASDVTSSSVFEQLVVFSTVSITSGATLTMSSAGGYIWNGTDTFRVIDNDAGDAITGTFTGPTLTNFLGSSLTAQQTYTGGTGNDLVFFAPPSSNADLSALVINTATYSPAFAAGTTTGYTASVSNATSSVTVTPTRAQANATIEARSNANAFASVTSGSSSGALNLNLGSNTLDVKVTAQDGTPKTYTVTVTRRSLIEDWRLGFFADASGTSNRANGADFDLDGKTNLLEFAFGTDPTLGSSGPPDLTMTGTYAAATFGVTGQPITKLEPVTNGVDYRAVFIRRVDHAAAGLTYTPEFSADNFTSFTASATAPTVLATSGSFQLVSVPYPHFLSNGKKARFFRVSVSIAP